MPFTSDGTTVTQTPGSIGYASELIGLVGVNNIGPAGFELIDTSAVNIVIAEEMIVDRDMVYKQISGGGINNSTLRIGNTSGELSYPRSFRCSITNVSISGLTIIADNAIISGGAIGYQVYNQVRGIFTDCLITNVGNPNIGFDLYDAVLTNTTVQSSLFVPVTQPVDTTGFRFLDGIWVFADKSDLTLSKASINRLAGQSRAEWTLKDVRITEWVGARNTSPANVTVNRFIKTFESRAAGAGANENTTLYVFGDDGAELAATPLGADGTAIVEATWGAYSEGSLLGNTNPDSLVGRMTVEMINTNTGTYQHIPGYYKLPLKTAFVGYNSAISVTTGIMFDVSAESYVENYLLAPNLIADPNITEATKATVDAYTTIETSAKFYDRAKSHLVDNYAGETETLVSRSGNEIDAGSYNVAIDASAASVFAFDGTTITIKASTYTGDMTTTGIITLANGATFVGTRTDANGTVAPPKVATISGITAGSRLQIYNVTTATEIVNQIIVGTSYTATYNEGTGYTTGDTVRVRLAYDSGATAKLPFSGQAIVGASGWSLLAAQQDDTVYNALGIDGSSVTEFTPDFPNVQVDISDPDGATRVDRLYAWFVHTQSSENGIRQWFNGIVPEDEANFRIVTATLDLKIDNVAATGVTFTDGRRLYRDDNTSPLVGSTSGGGSITFFSGKVYTSVVSTASPVITGDIADVPARVQQGMTAQGYTTAKAENLDASVQDAIDAAKLAAALSA